MHTIYQISFGFEEARKELIELKFAATWVKTFKGWVEIPLV
jgi:hypothetical protein